MKDETSHRFHNIDWLFLVSTCYRVIVHRYHWTTSRGSETFFDQESKCLVLHPTPPPIPKLVPNISTYHTSWDDCLDKMSGYRGSGFRRLGKRCRLRDRSGFDHFEIPETCMRAPPFGLWRQKDCVRLWCDALRIGTDRRASGYKCSICAASSLRKSDYLTPLLVWRVRFPPMRAFQSHYFKYFRLLRDDTVKTSEIIRSH